MNRTNMEYFDSKWRKIISKTPQGGEYHFYMRQYGYDLIKKEIPNNSVVYDYACGLGVIDKQLIEGKKCVCDGCDFSKIARKYATEGGMRRVIKSGFLQCPDKDKYDYIFAIYFIEHISTPVEWLTEALRYGRKVVITIPNDFIKKGEYINMQWNSWETFFALFKDFNLV